MKARRAPPSVVDLISNEVAVRATLGARSKETILEAAFRALAAPLEGTVVRAEVARIVVEGQGKPADVLARAAAVARPRPVKIDLPMRRIYK